MPAASVKAPGGVLSAQMMPPIQDVDSMVPIALTNPQPGVYVYDMGQNFSGWVDLHVTGPRGTQVQLRFAELLYDTGMINRENIRGGQSARHLHPARRWRGRLPPALYLSRLPLRGGHGIPRHAESRFAARARGAHGRQNHRQLCGLEAPAESDPQDHPLVGPDEPAQRSHRLRPAQRTHGLDGRCAGQRRRRDAELRHGGLLHQLPAGHPRRAGPRRHHHRYGSATAMAAALPTPPGARPFP